MIEELTIADLEAKIRSGRLEPLELLERCLEQIQSYEDRLHAWVVIDRQRARDAARQAGREAARGEFRGPLHGIPLGIKDIIDVEGLPTRAGSPLREDHLARSDAPLVAALRASGAIILGKTVTVEFACFDPSPTRNPWDPALARTPGGSSSGSAVAVAARMCPAAIGTQTGGSLVRPASYCGVATCKATFGSVDTGGVVPVSYHLDHPGPMARRVGDLEILLQCMLRTGQGRHPPDAAARWPESGSGWLPGSARGSKMPGTVSRGCGAEPSALPVPPRLGLVEQFFMEEAEEPIRQATETALARLRQGGATIETVRYPPGFAAVQPMHRRIMAVEAAAYHRRQFAAHRQSYGPLITSLLDEGLSISGVDYAGALGQQRDFRRQVSAIFDNLDALVMPATDTTAPANLGTTGTPKFQAPWSCAGLPVVSIPCGLASDGMPAALQLVQRHHHEAPLLEVAKWCERCLAFDQVPPLVG